MSRAELHGVRGTTVVLRVPRRTALRHALALTPLFVALPPVLGAAGWFVAAIVVALAVGSAWCELRRGGTTLDAGGIRPAGWLFHKIAWTRVSAVGAGGRLMPSGEAFLVLHDRRRPVVLPHTTRADVEVIEDVRLHVLSITS